MIDSYKRLPMGKYNEICEVCRDENLAEIDKQVKVIAILSDQPEEDILDLPINEYKERVKLSRFLETPSKEMHSRISVTYHVGTFVLEPCMDIRKITTAQYIDFQTFAPDAENKVVEILSCFLVPKGKAYNKDYDIVKVQQAMRESLSVSDAVCLSAFFLSRYRKLILDSLISSRQEAKRMKDCEEKETILRRIESQLMLLSRNGDGLPMSMQ